MIYIMSLFISMCMLVPTVLMWWDYYNECARERLNAHYKSLKWRIK